MATYLVTGAAGLIAARVSECLLDEGHTVVGIDNLNDYYDVRIKKYRLTKLLSANSSSTEGQSLPMLSGDPIIAGKLRFYVGDIEDPALLKKVFSEFRFDAVFNLAARAGVRASIATPHIYMATNAIGTLNILEAMRNSGVRKFVLASTSSLYAGCEMPYTEEQPVNTPISPYAASKKAAEMLAYTYHKLYNIDVSILRYFTVFGPAGRPDMSVFRFIKWIDEGQIVKIYGDGRQSRDFTYVDDICRGTILAARDVGFEVINLGGGNNPISLKQLIAFVEGILGRRALIEEEGFHAADVRETWADITKAKAILGWEPKVSAEEGFRRTVAWHQANRDWLKDIST